MTTSRHLFRSFTAPTLPRTLVVGGAALLLGACADPAPLADGAGGAGTSGAGTGAGTMGTDGTAGSSATTDSSGGQGSGGGTEGDGSCAQDPDSRIPCEFEGLADPDGWSQEPETGMRYRRATAQELERNGWPVGTFLVEADALIDAVESGAQTPPAFVVPLADDAAVAVALDGIGLVQGPPQIAITPQGADVIQPQLASYVSTGEALPEVLLNLTGTVGALRGVVGHGVVAGYNLVVRSHGSSWFVQDIPGGPQAPALARVVLQTLTPPQQGGYDDCGAGLCGDMCLAWAPKDCGPKLPNDPDACFYEGTNPCVNTQPTKDLKGCDDGIDNDGDGETDWDGWTAAGTPDDNCEHQSGCYGNGTGAANAHDHIHESGEDMMITGNLDWCTHDGDWYARAYEWAWRAADIFASPTGDPGYDVMTAHRDNLLRLAAVQCWVLPEAQVDACEDTGDCGAYGPNSAHPYPFAGMGYDEFGTYLDVAWGAVAHAADNGLERPVTLSAVFVRRYDGQGAGLGRFPNSATPGALGVRAEFEWTPPKALAHEIGHTLGLQHDENDPIMRASVGWNSPSEFTASTAAKLRHPMQDVNVPRPYTFGK